MINLSDCNKIIQQIARNNKFVTEVTPDDLPLFQSFFSKEPDTYGNSWIYVTQGVHGIGKNNLGYKYYDGKNLSMICLYPKVEQPETTVFYWIRPMGPSILKVIPKFSQQILSEYLFTTYVKKIFKTQFDYLLTSGFHDIKKYPWHSASPREDDTYPEQIIDVKKTLLLSETLPRKKHLRKSVVRAHHLTDEYAIVVGETNFKEIAWDLSQKFFHSQTALREKHYLSDEYDYYNLIFSNKNNPNIVKGIASIDEQPCGFFLGEKQNEKYTSLYALIILRYRIKYLVDYLMLHLLKNTKTPFLNLGGSEEEGIHDFKQKYFPSKELKMYWATNYH